MFKRNGKRFTPFGAAGELMDAPIPGIYEIGTDPFGGVWLDLIEQKFDLPAKLYGDVNKFTSRCFDTYCHRAQENKNTGILLAGTKGDGKSLTSRVLINRMIEGRKAIVINITEATDPNIIRSLASEVPKNIPVVIWIDEFEKRYHDKKMQQSLLTFMDGGNDQSIMFIYTVNNIYAVDEHFQNRPGRIYYMREYNGIDSEFIHEYCVDNLHNQNHIQSIQTLAKLFSSFSFDSLMSLVAEMNLYGENASEAIKYLALRPTLLTSTKNVPYKIKLLYKGEDVTSSITELPTFDSPHRLIEKHDSIYFDVDKKKMKEYKSIFGNSLEEDGYVHFNFRHPEDYKLTKIIPMTFSFEKYPDVTLEFEETMQPSKNHSLLL